MITWPAQAAGFFSEAVHVKPAAVAGLLCLGDCFQLLRLYDQALFYYHKALEIEPANELAVARLREVLADVRLYGEMHRFVPIYASWAGARLAEICTWRRSRHHLDMKTSLAHTGAALGGKLWFFGPDQTGVFDPGPSTWAFTPRTFSYTNPGAVVGAPLGDGGAPIFVGTSWHTELYWTSDLGQTWSRFDMTAHKELDNSSWSDITYGSDAP